MSTERNLLLRIASALVLLPIVLFLVWKGGAWWVGLTATVAGLCGYEFASMAALAGGVGRGLVALAAGLLPVLHHLLPEASAGPVLAAVYPGLAVLFFLVHLARPGEDLAPVPARVGLSLLGVTYTGGLVVAITAVREVPGTGLWWIVLLMAVTWLNDTGAYFAGRLFGRRPLYRKVSPGKTLEGAVGGLLFSVGAAFLVPWVSHRLALDGVQPLALEPWACAVLGVGAGLLGPAGDLSESLVKRAFGAKDSSRLIPGHGGFLDRIDALLFNGLLVYVWAVLL